MAFKGIKLDLKTGGSGGAAEASLRDSAIFVKCNVTLEEKINQLFESQSDAVFQFLAAVFGGADVGGIEDVTQEAFFRLYRALQRGEQIENLRSWLFRVAHNTAIDRIRAQRFVTPIDEIRWDEIREQMPDPALNPEQLTLKLEELAQLHEAVKRLSLQERQCLHLRAEGFRYREIAEILEIATPTVGGFLRRAVRKLMREFGE